MPAPIGPRLKTAGRHPETQGEVRVDLGETPDSRLYRVLVNGRAVGSVRRLEEGWMCIGVFHSGIGTRTHFFRTEQEAARALVERWLERLVEARRGEEKQDAA